MDSNDKRNQVIAWIKAGCSYNHGVLLYSEFGRNESLKKLFPGKQHRYGKKLMYELCKSAGIDWENLTSQAQPQKKQTPVIINHSDHEEQQFATNVAGYPPVIRRVIMEYTEQFQLRSKTHALMAGLGESNADAVKVKRKELFDLVKGCTVRLEQLFEVRQRYENKGELPNEDELWPKPKPAPMLPENADALKKIKKNLQTSNAKDQILLDYQTKTKQAKENQMPAGPKRMKLENRIKGRNKKIEEIDYKLNKIQE